jgi:hypothetical protein
VNFWHSFESYEQRWVVFSHVPLRFERIDIRPENTCRKSCVYTVMTAVMTATPSNFPEEFNVHIRTGNDWFTIFNSNENESWMLLWIILWCMRGVCMCVNLVNRTNSSFVLIVSCAASGSRRTRNNWLWAVTVRRRYTRRRR